MTLDPPLETWSELGPKNLLKERKAATTFKPTASDIARAECRSDTTIRWVFVDTTGKFRTVFAPAFWEDDVDPTPYYTGSTSDEISTFSPGYFDEHAYHSFGIALLSKKDTEEANFVFLDGDDKTPEEINKPGEADENNTLADLGFPNAEGENSPVFAMLPLLLPIPPGYFIPEGKTASEELPTCPPRSELYHPFQIWAKAIRHMHQFCNDLTATGTANPLFRPAEVKPNATDYPNITFRDTFKSPVTAMSITHKSFDTSKDLWSDAKQKSIMAWYADQRPISDGSPVSSNHGGTPATGSPDLRELSKAIAKGITLGSNATSTSGSSSTKQEKADVILQYRILFARNGKKNEEDTADEMILADLSPRFLKFLDSSKKHQKKNIQEPFALFMTKLLKSEKNADQGVTFKYKQFDTPFIAALSLFNWLGSPLNRDRQSISNQLSIPHFLTVDSNDTKLKSREEREREATAQALADEDITKMSKKEVTLYFNGKQRQPNDLKAAIFNLRALGKFITEDFDSSALWEALSSYLSVLTSSEDGRSWINQQSVHAHTVHALLMEAQLIVGRFVAISKELEHRDRLSKNESVDNGPLSSALVFSEQVRNKIAQAVATASDEPYIQKPTTFHIFFPALSDQKKRSITDDSPSPKKTKSGPTPRNTGSENDDRKKKGILKWNGTGKIPFCTGNLVHPQTGSRERLCLGHIFQARACTRDTCKFVHVNRFADLDADGKATLKRYVDANEQIQWASGKGPSPGTATT
jgi:hypothetical protein